MDEYRIQGGYRMTHHYFIGVKVSADIREQLGEWQQVLAEFMDYKDWTSSGDFHITLKFLGGCTDEKIEEYIEKLKSKTWPEEFMLQIGPAGSFGDKECPRVFHATVELVDPLLQVKNQVDEVGETIGFEKEKRKFRPHVTLAKKNARGSSPLLRSGENDLFHEQFQMKVDHFGIYRIHPKQSPKYEEVATITFRGE